MVVQRGEKCPLSPSFPPSLSTQPAQTTVWLSPAKMTLWTYSWQPPLILLCCFAPLDVNRTMCRNSFCALACLFMQAANTQRDVRNCGRMRLTDLFLTGGGSHKKSGKNQNKKTFIMRHMMLQDANKHPSIVQRWLLCHMSSYFFSYEAAVLWILK